MFRTHNRCLTTTLMSSQESARCQESIISSYIRQSHRLFKLALQPRLKSALEDMEQKGVISKCDGPTDWVSSLLIVEKKNGTLRLCLDPRDLNRAVKREHFVLPTCNDVL